MNIRIFTRILILFLNTDVDGEEELPDNYLPFSFKEIDDQLLGECQYLEGFTFSMDLSVDLINYGLDKANLFAIVNKQNIIGKLTYPNGRKTKIEYEVVNHRGINSIYMKTSLGYFLWEMLDIKPDELYFDINWWYYPPERPVDLETLEMTDNLLSDPANWHQEDDRKCENDIKNGKWSLFCALKHSSIEKMGEYNHHNTAMQAVRFVIDDLIPDHRYAHTLMDFNNSQSTTHTDILNALDSAKNRIKQQLVNQEASSF